ncbi:TIGR02117 family protein [Mariniphaga sp.]|uniref:TIGR02117 family protein n=1 Tax=Mariniphaga sp. TaxID=1954475 RepID=UPI0035612B36
MRRQKEIVKNSLKFLKNIFLALVAGIAFYLGIAALFSFLPTHPPKQNCLPQHEIFVASNGIHLDIILPVENITPQILHNLDVLPGTLFIGFGWGDKEFYIKTPVWSDLTIPVAFRALFLKSETAMHVTYLPRSFPSWKKIQLCANQLKKLNFYIENSFVKDDHGNLKKMDFEGYSRFDDFYDANGSFSLFRTCNVWVNVALKEIGIKTSVWSPFDLGVLYHLKTV